MTHVVEGHSLKVFIAHSLGHQQIISVGDDGHAIVAASVHFEVEWPSLKHLRELIVRDP